MQSLPHIFQMFVKYLHNHVIFPLHYNYVLLYVGPRP